MRIISGKHKGKKLTPPPDAKTTRPITDRVKESVFNLLRGHWEGARVVDLFTGTGSIGLEAYSRGAARVLMVEKDRTMARIVQRNIESVGNPAAVDLLIGDALGPAALSRAPTPVHILFADPPYPLVRDPDGWDRVRAQFMRVIDLMTYEGFAVLRTPWPFLHARDRTPPAAAGKTTGGKAGQKTLTVDLDAAGDDELDRIEAEFMKGAHAGGFDEVDLELDNAIGPETHVYGTTAIHLYMRRRPEDEHPDGAAPEGGDA
jgi:16S rRNA G966 N2-methylase RsmD